MIRELGKLNDTLADIKTLLERITDTQGLDVLMKRMELSSAQATEAEKRLRSAESERASIEDQILQWERSLQSYTAEVESGALEDSAVEFEALTAQTRSEIARYELRMRDLDDEISGLRNRLDARRRELEDWQGYVDRRLGGV